MKGITLCAECTYYDKKKHRCKRGASKERFAIDPFYDDCPLPDVVEVRHAKWVSSEQYNGRPECPVCFYVTDEKTNYCPHCGCKMDREE